MDNVYTNDPPLMKQSEFLAPAHSHARPKMSFPKKSCMGAQVWLYLLAIIQPPSHGGPAPFRE